MKINDIDVHKASKLVSDHVDAVTCLECCKYYVAPEKAICGHTLCHTCWKGRRVCPACGKAIKRKDLKIDASLQYLTEHIIELVESFEQLFDIKMDDFMIDLPSKEKELEDDPTSNVKHWLTNSDNHFSAPPFSDTQQSTQEILPPIQLSTSKIQIHTESNKKESPAKVLHSKLPQDDWDKIEVVPDSEDIFEKRKESGVGPMDLEPFFIDDNEYTTENPRKSTRNSNKKPESDLNSHQSSIVGIDKKSEKTKQNRNNIKRMKKEFNKLSKINKNKLNVSIEMCKKTQATKQIITSPPEKQVSELVIDENTPTITSSNKENIDTQKIFTNDIIPCSENILNNSTFKLVSKENDKTEKHDSYKIKEVDDVVNKAVQTSIVTVANSLKESTVKIPFIKKSTFQPDNYDAKNKEVYAEPQNVSSSNSDDIHITIRIGDVVTNITINKKQNDVQLNVKTDREIQTSPRPNFQEDIQFEKSTDKEEKKFCQKSAKKPVEADKSVSTKKNTASAETNTAQYEITESVEKELSSIMECEEVEQNESILSAKTKILKVNEPIGEPMKSDTKIGNAQLTQDILKDFDDIDIFNSGSVKEQNIQLLKDSHYAASEILISTNKTAKKTQKRSIDHAEETESKKAKLDLSYNKETNDVFTEPDIEIIESIKTVKGTNKSLTENFNRTQNFNIVNNSEQISQSLYAKRQVPVEKFSENMFSTVGNVLEKGNKEIPGPETQNNIECLLTPNICDNLNSKDVSQSESMVLCTPAEDGDDDKSVVEDTPQKDTSIKTKSKSDSFSRPTTTTKKLQLSKPDKKSSNTETEDMDVITISDSIREEIKTNNQVSETPLTINRFVNQITHKSTPVARKSLDFTRNQSSDPDFTLCPNNSFVGKTTQEKQFMAEAFNSQSNPNKSKNDSVRKFYIAGSCLTSTELTNLRILCFKKKWSYIDKYTPDLTHLVVGVDDENRSQRSVKFMCALAAGNWIVSYKWVEKCLETNTVVSEEPYEALDSTGDPGPRNSRLSSKKLFDGIIFFCMPPFSVLDVETLKSMLEAAGGNVVKEPSQVRVNSSGTPALLLAEPEQTQEDRFLFLAMELGIVPVNYEWALNCLGSYSLCPIEELLLCPPSLLPKSAAKWPSELIGNEEVLKSLLDN